MLRTDLIRLLQKHRGKKYVTVKHVYDIRRSYRGNLARVQGLFALAALHGAGVVEWVPSDGKTKMHNPNPFRLGLTLDSMTEEQRLSLRVLAGSAHDDLCKFAGASLQSCSPVPYVDV